MVCKVTLFLCLLNCFFLIFALFLSYLVWSGFIFQDLFGLCPASEISTLLGWLPTGTIVPLPSPAALVQCRWRISSCEPDLFASLLPLVVSSHNLNFIILSDGRGWNLVLLSQLLGRGRRHNLPVNVGKCIEMPFTVLAPVRGHKGLELHLDRCYFSDGRKREESRWMLLHIGFFFSWRNHELRQT